jgi:methyltransferase (TIGR00027 family)
MRLFIAARTHFAEEAFARAVEGGVHQLVILGAGLDTYAYRGLLRHRVHIFEVDHPATQAWKRQRLASAAIAAPSSLTFAPIDFERESLSGGLAASPFDPAQQTFFFWLGVVPYLNHGRGGFDSRLYREFAWRRARRVRLQQPSGYAIA